MADPEAAQDNLRNAGQFGSGDVENFTGEQVAILGGGEHNGEQIGEVRELLMAAPHELLAGDDLPFIHDAGDEAAAAAHIHGTQALRNRTLADPVSRSFI